jgi:RES domain/HEPN/RES N-terminal domain 1
MAGQPFHLCRSVVMAASILDEFEPDGLGEERVCSYCVGDQYLQSLIRNDGEHAACTYCNKESNTFAVVTLADLVEKVFEIYFERTSTEPEGIEIAMLSDRESSYEWQRSGESALDIIANLVSVDDPIAEAVLSVLEDRHSDFDSHQMGEECPFDTDSHYTKRELGDGGFGEMWCKFQHHLKTETRFFSQSAHGLLDQIFGDCSNLRRTNGGPVVVTAGPGTSLEKLYRARVFAADQAGLEEALKEPWKYLGPPQSKFASAGRMNAQGISVFYGAKEPSTALAEVRPPVGGQVAVARFVINRPLRLLDLEALKRVKHEGSMFDPMHIERIQKVNFLRKLRFLLSSPVMPNEAALGYLPTQAVADYLASEAKLDGIVFRSVQVGSPSSNVVLFYHASRVEQVVLPEGTKITVRLDSGEDPDIVVCEALPSEQVSSIESSVDRNLMDHRKVSLTVDVESIRVQCVTAVKYVVDELEVIRCRSVKQNAWTGQRKSTSGAELPELPDD